MSGDAHAVIFDIGNVLVGWDVRALYRQLLPDEQEMERFLAEVWSPAENDRCDQGTPFAEVIAEVVERHPDDEHLIRAAWDRWIETITGPVPGMLEILEELSARGVPMVALSNFSAETFPLVRDRYPHFALLDDIVISGEHPPLAKPDREIFELVRRRNVLEAGATLFVDDVQANVEAARELGFRTHLFAGAAPLREALAEHGLLAPRRSPREARR